MTNVQTGSTTALEEAVGNAVVAPTKGKTLQDEIRAMTPQLAAGIPSGTLTPERFVRTILTEVRKTPKLLECTRESFLGSMMQVAQLGLEAGGPLGQAFLLPYRNRQLGVTECQLQIGAKGYIALGYRAGIIMEAREVYENDDFDFDFASEPPFHHTWKLGKGRGELIGFYGTARMPDGRTKFHVMDLDEIEKRRQRAGTKDTGPWKTDFIAMARKTLIRAMVNQMPLATESSLVLAEAARVDDATIHQSRSGDLKVTYQDPDDGTTPVAIEATSSSSGDAVADAINAIEPNAQRLAASRDILRVFGPPDSMTELQRQQALAVAQGWPETKAQLAKLEGPAPTEVVVPTEVVGQASQSVTDEILDGMPAELAAEAENAIRSRFGDEYDGDDEAVQDFLGEWMSNREEPQHDIATGEIVDNLRSTGGTASDDLLESTKKNVSAWDMDRCKEVLGMFNLPRTGSLDSMRARLIVHLAPLRQAHAPSVTDLF